MLVFDEPSLRVYATHLSEEGLAAARTAVGTLLKEAFPAEHPMLRHTPDGAPYIDGVSGSPAISISHSGSQALLAVSVIYAAVGIDTETYDRDTQLERVKHKYLATGQQERWGPTPYARLVAWCIKEAVYKCALKPGVPLVSIPLPDIGFLECGSAEVEVGELHINLRLLTELDGNGPIVVAWRDKHCKMC